MDFQSYFPVWNKLTPAQQERILGSLMDAQGKQRDRDPQWKHGLHRPSVGEVRQLRAYILSDEGARSPSTVCLTGICACFPPPVSCVPFSSK